MRGLLLKLFFQFAAIALKPFGLRAILTPTTSGTIVVNPNGSLFMVPPAEACEGTGFILGFEDWIQFLVSKDGRAATQFSYRELDRIKGTSLAAEASAAEAEAKAVSAEISQQ